MTDLTACRLGLKPIPYNPVSGMQVVQKWIVPQSAMWEWADEILELRAEVERLSAMEKEQS